MSDVAQNSSFADAGAFRKWREGSIHGWLLICALLSIITTVGIIYVLVSESIPFFRHVRLVDFLTGQRWSPQLDPQSFGVLPLVSGTFLVAIGSLLFAVPIGLGSALYLSEYAPRWMRQMIKPILEVLAGVPTVVYGFFALTFITPYVLKPLLLPYIDVDVFNAACAAIVVGIMIIPTISSLSDDAFRAVPGSLRDSAYALAATPLEVSTRVVLPAGLPGVVAAVLLAFSRAIGETMAVTLAAGATPNLTLNPFVSIQTMTSYIVNISMGEAAAGSLDYQSLYAVGITLFVITFAINVFAQRMLARFQESYE